MPDLAQQGEIEISGDKYFHLARSVRSRPGDQFRLFNGKGLFATAEILTIDSRSVYANIMESEIADNRLRIRLSLAFGLLPQEPLKILIAGATQLGVDRFIPFTSKFNDLRISSSKTEKITERWEKLIIENSAIASRSHIPSISDPVDFSQLPGLSNEYDRRFVFWEEGGEPWTNCLPVTEGTAMIVIGPKGGLDTDEIEILRESGFRILSLGQLILKAEIAAIAACSRVIGE